MRGVSFTLSVAGRETGPLALTSWSVAPRVVPLPARSIAENLEGLRDLLKLSLRVDLLLRARVGVLVRVVLEDEAPVRVLDFLRLRVNSDAKRLVRASHRPSRKAARASRSRATTPALAVVHAPVTSAPLNRGPCSFAPPETKSALAHHQDRIPVRHGC